FIKARRSRADRACPRRLPGDRTPAGSHARQERKERKSMNTKNTIRLLVATVFALGLGACATSKSVDEKIAAAQAANSQKIESVSTQVEDLQQKQKATDVHLAQTDTQISQLSATAQDALKRAQDAGVLAKGKVVFEQTFTEDRVKFQSGKYELSKDAQSALGEFSGKVKALTDPYF